MDTQLESQLQARLASYLRGGCSLEAFEDWFVPHALSAVESSGNPDTDQLIYEIELRLAEFSHGDRTERELKQVLQPLIQAHGIRQ